LVYIPVCHIARGPDEKERKHEKRFRVEKVEVKLVATVGEGF